MLLIAEHGSTFAIFFAGILFFYVGSFISYILIGRIMVAVLDIDDKYAFILSIVLGLIITYFALKYGGDTNPLVQDQYS